MPSTTAAPAPDRLTPSLPRFPRRPTGRTEARLTAALVGTVVFLTGIAPLATDMYVPAFPDVARDLTASATQVQLTLTTFFVGMALGQLVGGPVRTSAADAVRWSRRSS